MKLRIIIFTVCIILFIQCKKQSETIEANFDQEFTIKVDQLIKLKQDGNSSDIEIKLNKIIADQRCAIQHACLWEGTFIAQIDFNGEKINVSNHYFDSSTFEFEGFTVFPKPFEFENYLINLESTLPFVDVNKEIEEKDYELTFKITR